MTYCQLNLFISITRLRLKTLRQKRAMKLVKRAKLKSEHPSERESRPLNPNFGGMNQNPCITFTIRSGMCRNGAYLDNNPIWLQATLGLPA